MASLDDYLSPQIFLTWFHIGVTKTHRLLLQANAAFLSPRLPEDAILSRITVTSRAVKDLLEHLTGARANKQDARLIWTFGDVEVRVKSLNATETLGMYACWSRSLPSVG